MEAYEEIGIDDELSDMVIAFNELSRSRRVGMGGGLYITRAEALDYYRDEPQPFEFDVWWKLIKVMDEEWVKLQEKRSKSKNG